MSKSFETFQPTTDEHRLQTEKQQNKSDDDSAALVNRQWAVGIKGGQCAADVLYNTDHPRPAYNYRGLSMDINKRMTAPKSILMGSLPTEIGEEIELQEYVRRDIVDDLYYALIALELHECCLAHEDYDDGEEGFQDVYLSQNVYLTDTQIMNALAAIKKAEQST